MSQASKTCGARHADIVVLSYRCEVRCQRNPNHRGHHRAMPMGRLVEWIEPHKMRGIAKRHGDERGVSSPSDHRTNPPPPPPPEPPPKLSWWARLVRLFK